MLKDMTCGKPLKLILAFSLPLIAGNLLQQIYGLTDTIVLGRFVGWEAIGATGSSGPVTFLLFSFIFGLTSGFAIITGQRFGAHDPEGVRRSIATGLALCGGISLASAGIFIAGIDPILRFLDVPQEIYRMSRTYLLIVLSGTTGIMLYNYLASVLRALGDSRTPLGFVALSVALNIALDLFFILVCRGGVAGVAWATVASQILAGVGCFLYVWFRYPELRLKRGDWGCGGIAAHLKQGLPMGVQFCLIAVGCFIMQKMLNRLGPVAVSGFATACQVDRLFTMFIYSITATVGAFVAQNYGAKRFDRICNGTTDASVFAVIFGFTGCAGVILLYPELTRIFVGEEQMAPLLPFVRDFMYCRSPFYFAVGLMFIYRNALQSMGYSAIPLLAGICDLVCRSLLCIWWGTLFGYRGVCFGDVSSWVITGALLAVPYFSTIRRRTGNFLRTPYRETPGKIFTDKI
ncbi:MAG: MATE family efflux transporter [Victivallaceae bacterium]|nr:MATE family efflux transporter [Victivallaceae bacterium]